MDYLGILDLEVLYGGVVNDSEIRGETTSSSFVGGIWGRRQEGAIANNFLIRNSKVSSLGNYVGGIAGYASGYYSRF